MESWDGYRDISSPPVEDSSMLHVVLGVCGPWVWPEGRAWEAGKETKESEYSVWPVPWNKGAWCKYCEPSPSVQIDPLLVPWTDSV
jgi:hypothetical protein